MYIRKTTNDYGNYDVAMEEDNKLLKIFQSGQDTNISCRYSNFQNFSVISFVIKEEHDTLYPLFEELYNQIINAKFQTEGKNKTILNKEEEEKHSSWYKQIVSENGITILSDLLTINNSNILRIQKKEKKIVLYFVNDNKEKEKLREEYKESHSINICIRQIGSRLGDFAIPFHSLFKKLQDIPSTKETKQKEGIKFTFEKKENN